jgi:hypothetical protein
LTFEQKIDSEPLSVLYKFHTTKRRTIAAERVEHETIHRTRSNEKPLSAPHSAVSGPLR